MKTNYLYTMIRLGNLQKAIGFYTRSGGVGSGAQLGSRFLERRKPTL